MAKWHHHTGIYLTRSQAHWAIVTTHRNGSIIENHDYHHDLSDSQSLSRFINDLQQQHPYHYRKPQVILNHDWHLTKKISFNKQLTKTEFSRYLQQQAIHEFNVAYADLLVDYQRLPTLKKQGHCAYIIAACQKSSLYPMLNIITPKNPPSSILIDVFGVNTCYKTHHACCHLILINLCESHYHSSMIKKKRILAHQSFDFLKSQHYSTKHIYNEIHAFIDNANTKKTTMTLLLGPQTDALLNLKENLVRSRPNITTECLLDKVNHWRLSSSNPYHHGMATLAALKGRWHAN